MKNTLENKAKFFALYWGQPVLNSDRYGKEFIISYFNPGQSNVDGVAPGCNYHLELIPLSRITDEELKPIYPHGVKAFFTYYGSKERAIEILTYECDRNEADFLRSKGYALPWLDTTVEQQIEYGWLKLKT